ncbi:L,D-transpeptidase family protein [Rhabdaerophilum sp. SD176]|uniref:L,D-transpeptidase family protein n=1 Tax=Rhabdaerophilum sp. SD176 TaxID=2983548 RepID=UPI0024E0049C|nr:L,D-transpeptidase family protein [Rhabdaerophilum sp. SD176]
MRRLALVIVVLFSSFVAFDLSKISRNAPPLVDRSERADLIIIRKSERSLKLIRKNTEIRSYTVSLGRNPSGHKQQEGDKKTPEGRYFIDFRNQRSAYHLALRISYPNAVDSAVAAARHVPPGSDIMIHGIRNGLGFLGGLHRLLDWTNGCVAVTNTEIEDLWKFVDIGTPVEIRP